MANILAAIKEFFAKIIAAIKGIFNKGEENEPTEEISGPDDIVCYYGCPNSDKAKKLQTGKKLWE